MMMNMLGLGGASTSSDSGQADDSGEYEEATEQDMEWLASIM